MGMIELTTPVEASKLVVVMHYTYINAEGKEVLRMIAVTARNQEQYEQFTARLSACAEDAA